MITRTFIWISMGILLLTGLSLGGYDPSGQIAAENLSMDSFNALGMENDTGGAALADPAPQTTASGPGDEMAVYTDQMPSQSSLGKLTPFDSQASTPGNIYYSGNYMAWNSFGSVFPRGQPGLWISGSDGWSWYVTMPLGSWTQELLYVPYASYLSMYEVYPGGSARRYNLGFVQPGYYLIWYYADAPGRHFSQFALGNKYSNTVVIDVYYQQSPQPIGPTPKEQCEQNPQCSWANGHCYCRGLNPDPGPMPGPVPNPVAECEANPSCHYVDGQCLCTGVNPEPEPGPVPNPAAECEKNPACHYVDGQCLCTGAGTSGSSGSSGGLTDSS
ncbi:MAG TPA: hypothetical protein VN455_13260 [Methanotrichaceae archaeon]|nr:hypothetical protein [Methanotrichaceae archaeon]